jgi:hypothetical protein
MHGTGHGDDWCVEIHPPERPVLTYWEEIKIVCGMVYEQRTAPLQLCLSGGLDSEFVLATLLNLGIPVEVVIMETQYNSHETQYAFKFCESKNITPTVIDLDFDWFVNSGKLIEIAESSRCAAWQWTANMWLTEQLSGTVITGDDPPHLTYNDRYNLWYVDEDEIHHSLLAFWTQKNISGTPFMLKYNAESMLSFLLDPYIQKLANHNFPGKLGSNSTKVHVFNRVSNYNLEQRAKKHGYEMIEKSNIYNHPDIQTVISWKSKWNGISRHPYHDLVDKLSTGQVSKAFAWKY